MSEKIDLGTATEDDVQRFVEHSFGVDFVFRSPFHEKGGKQKETTDVLAVFDDVAIPIQVKAQAYNVDGSPRDESSAWVKKNLQKAVAQVNGAVRTLRGAGSVRLDNVRRGTLDFDRSKSRYFYGVVILNHVSRPFLAEEIVPEIATSPFPIHVFSFTDFYNLAQIFDTPGDLTGYLEMRADVLVPTAKPKVHDERPAFELYIERFEELTEFRAKRRGDAITATQVAPYATALREIYAGTLPNLRESYYIDQIIDAVHEVDESLPSPFDDAERAGKSSYALIAESLARIVRPRRAILGRQFLDAITRGAEKNDIAFAHASSKRRDECLLFLASPRPQSERGERNRELRDYLMLLKATRGVRRAIGIGTEAGHESGRSYDLIFVESDPADLIASPDYPEIKENGEVLFGVSTPV
jgi:hypothetical protein